MWLAMNLTASGGAPRQSRAWFACVCVALAPLAHADGLSNTQVLGVTESALSYCGARDPVSADRLRQKIKQLVQGASAQRLAEVRSSYEYRKAYDSMADFVARIDPHNAKRFCAETSVARN